MLPLLYIYVFAGSLVVHSERAMDGGRERERGQQILIVQVWKSIEQLQQKRSTAD